MAYDAGASTPVSVIASDVGYTNLVAGAELRIARTWFKKAQVVAGTDRTYDLAKTFGIKTAFGTDILFPPVPAPRQGAMLAKMTRCYAPAELLKMTTSSNAELLALSGLRSPYPGKLGVVEEGALADLILVDGNPLENIEIVAAPAKGFFVIMKDGEVVKNLVPR